MSLKQVKPGVFFGDGTTGTDPCDLEKYQRLVRVSGLPPATRLTARFHNFEEVPGREAGLKAAIDFVNGQIDPPLLLLYGLPGRSKTYLAWAIGWAFLAQLRSIIYYEVVDLLDALRARKKLQAGPVDHLFSESFDGLMEIVLTRQLLILDDMAAEKETDFTAERLDFIVNNRFVNKKATVITANTLEISDRILDRCKEGLLARLQGESYRDIIQKRKKSQSGR